MKLYIHTDIEGVAGMVHFEDRKDDTTEGYHRRRRLHKLLTGEVNAAIEWALEMGVDEILVNDAHGSGYSIIFEDLNPAAQIIHGPLTRQPFWMPCLDETVDMVFCVAQHAMAGTNGLLAHSCWCVNDDLYFGEGGMAMALAGYYDIPALLITGDNVATAQCRELVPEMEAVVVKEALSPYNAKSWTPARAREMIKEGAKRAVGRKDEIPPFKIAGPYTVGLAPGRGKPPANTAQGDDFRDIVYEILCRNYDYDLQKLPVWPLEPGRRRPVKAKGQRAQEEREKK